MSDAAEDWAEHVASQGLLTERQALVFFLREVEGMRRVEIAEKLDVHPSAVDDHFRRAREKIESARGTLNVLSGTAGLEKWA